MLVPNVTWFVLGIFKFNLLISFSDNAVVFPHFKNFFFMKSGFKLLTVLYISIHNNIYSPQAHVALS